MTNEQFEINRARSLDLIEQVGKLTKARSQLGYWSCEDNYRMATYAPLVPVLRECYWHVKHAETTAAAKAAVVKAMNELCGIERGTLHRAFTLLNS